MAMLSGAEPRGVGRPSRPVELRPTLYTVVFPPQAHALLSHFSGLDMRIFSRADMTESAWWCLPASCWDHFYQILPSGCVFDDLFPTQSCTPRCFGVVLEHVVGSRLFRPARSMGGPPCVRSICGKVRRRVCRAGDSFHCTGRKRKPMGLSTAMKRNSCRRHGKIPLMVQPSSLTHPPTRPIASRRRPGPRRAL